MEPALQGRDDQMVTTPRGLGYVAAMEPALQGRDDCDPLGAGDRAFLAAMEPALQGRDDSLRPCARPGVS